jgi:hypothetical protein
MPNNFQSIVGGIFRGLSNDRRSVALTGSNVKTDNPLTFTWIGQETSDLRQPIEKEVSSNPSLPFEKTTPGTQYEYANTLPTDVRTLVKQGSPGTDVSIRDKASSVGSSTLVPTGFAPINNAQNAGVGMSPQNGDHFKSYFANQIGLSNQLPVAHAASTLQGVMEEQSRNITGSADVWHGSWQTFVNMRKRYNPNQTYYGGP